MLNKIARYILEKLRLYSLYLLRKNSPLYDDGWFKSFDKKSSIDLKENPIPWFTYPALEFISERIRPNMSVFEYGCGHSTLWWAYRVHEVISCEHNEEWYKEIHSRIPSNVTLYKIDFEYGGEYSKKIAEYEKRFDIIAIDGRDRVNCVINSIQALKIDGIIILDNSDREEYNEGYHFLFENGFQKIKFVGLAPMFSIKTETGIFYRSDNCLGI